MYKCSTYKSLFSQSAAVFIHLFFMMQEFVAGQIHPPKHHPEKQPHTHISGESSRKYIFLNDSLPETLGFFERSTKKVTLWQLLFLFATCIPKNNM